MKVTPVSTTMGNVTIIKKKQDSMFSRIIKIIWKTQMFIFGTSSIRMALIVVVALSVASFGLLFGGSFDNSLDSYIFVITNMFHILNGLLCPFFSNRLYHNNLEYMEHIPNPLFWSMIVVIFAITLIQVAGVILIDALNAAEPPSAASIVPKAVGCLIGQMRVCCLGLRVGWWVGRWMGDILTGSVVG